MCVESFPRVPIKGEKVDVQDNSYTVEQVTWKPDSGLYAVIMTVCR